MLRTRPRFRLLGAFQALAGLALLPFVALDGWAGAELPVLMVAIGWLTLAVIGLIGGDRLPTVGYELSLYASTALVLLHAAVTPRPAIQVLDGLELLILMIAAAFALTEVRVRILLVLVCGLYLAALTVNPLALGLWIGPVIVAMVVATTLVVLRLLEEITRVSEHDPLTGALNRVGLRSRAQVVQALTSRTGLPTTVVFIDLDGFKPYNDRYGHVAGDRLLVDLVTVFGEQVRQTDLIARMGGDEFVLVLPGVTPHNADVVMSRLTRLAPLGFTYGMCEWRAHQDFLAAVDEADRLMYQHKQRRRGHVRRPVR